MFLKLPPDRLVAQYRAGVGSIATLTAVPPELSAGCPGSPAATR
jgi:hypothetical protein